MKRPAAEIEPKLLVSPKRDKKQWDRVPKGKKNIGTGTICQKMHESKYIYAIINAAKPEEFELVGIGGRGDKVHTVHYKDLAAVVSSSLIVKYPVSRENSIVHQQVLEKVMEKNTILPVRFCTIAEDEKEIKEKVLKARYEEFKSLLDEMKDKIEVGVRAIWPDTEKIFAEITNENRLIKELKEKIVKEKSEQRAYAAKIQIGEMIKLALGEKKEKEAKELLAALKPLSVDFKEKEVYGDRNVANFAFLIKKAKEREFDQKINDLVKELGERTKLKYFGPIPPYNFVEVVVRW